MKVLILLLLSINGFAQSQQPGYIFRAVTDTTFDWFNPLSLPISTAQATVNDTKLSTATASAMYQPIGTYATGGGSATGTNTGDNAANTTYANDYRAANFIAGTNYVAPGGALGTPSSGTLTNCTFPTLNQNTTGTAAGLSADIAQSRVTNLVSDLALKAPLNSPSLVTPNIGVATATSVAATAAITSSGTAGIGYTTGAGGTVTQNANRTTGVTLNKICGAITTNNASLAAGAEATFVVTNSTVAIGDVILLSARSGQTTNTSVPFVSQVANGSFSITLSNLNASTADTGAMVINFIVLKSVSN